ncbi:histidine phosphatase family protein [Deltaproteobacteria bacterium TL4]
MKWLYLLRHAKSSWKDEKLSDHDRPLAKRGQRDAPRVARVLHNLEHPPELILSSTAVRAVQTAMFLCETCFQKTPFIKVERLYEASPGTLLRVIQEQSDQYRALVMVAHNPGLEDLVMHLTPNEEYVQFPTAALAGFKFEVNSWKGVDLGKGTLETLVYSRSLEEI